MKLFSTTYELLLEIKPENKISGTRALYEAFKANKVVFDSKIPVAQQVIGGLPERLVLVSPRDVERRRLNSNEGKAAMIHALCHIEYNAINIALDALYRFREMPYEYQRDWLRVACEEAYHFSLLQQHLNNLGYDYGDFAGHNSLWEMTEKTSTDVLHRMALVPRLLEARGLDVTPDVAKKLYQSQDKIACEILSIIFHDEIVHVQTGNYWFNYICENRKLCPHETFSNLLDKFAPTYIRGPISIAARQKAGFKISELELINKLISLRSNEKVN